MRRHGPDIFAGTTIAAAVALAGLPASVQAQTTPQTGAPSREEIERGRPAPVTPEGPSRLTVEGGIERAPCPLADPQYNDVTIAIDSVQFNNLSAVPPDRLASAWRDYAGKTVPVATLCEIRDRAATLLRDMGYLAAIKIPPQRIETGGVITFDVLMARLTAVQVRGDAGNSEKTIAALLRGLTDEPVFNTHDAERRLLLADDLPGFDVRLVLRPADAAAPGDVVGEVFVKRRPLQVSLNVQNYGSRAVGRFGGLARVQVNDLTGLGDSTVFSFVNTFQTSEQTVAGIGHSFAIGADGLRLSGDFTYAWSKPDIGAAGFKSKTLIASAQLSYPLIRRQETTISTALGFEAIDQKVRFGDTPLTTDKLRVATAQLGFDLIDPASLGRRGDYSAAEPRWRVGGTLSLRQGLSVLGASDDCGTGLARCLPPNTPISRLDGDPTATIVRLSANAEYRPIPDLTFSLRPRAQYSASPLLSYEQIGAGNYTVGRGYDPGTLLGDSGVGVSAEVRFGSASPHGVNDLAFQPFVFFDQAWSWTNDDGPLDSDPQRLSSLGGGVRGAWGNHARFDLGLAVPLRRAPLERRKRDVRFLFTITTQLFPWSEQ